MIGSVLMVLATGFGANLGLPWPTAIGSGLFLYLLFVAIAWRATHNRSKSRRLAD